MNETIVTRRPSPFAFLATIVWYALGIIELILTLRFFMKLFAANAAAPFTTFVYNLSAPLLAPFRNVFPATGVTPGVFEWSTLLAIFVYWLVAFAIVELLTMGVTSTTHTTVIDEHGHRIG